MNAQDHMSVSTGPLVNSPSLPGEYRLPLNLILCGNRLQNVKIPIVYRNVPILLVGDGPFPLVWIAGPTDAQRQNWRWVVSKSIARSNLLKVDIDGDTSEVRVSARDNHILRVVKTGPNEIEVLQLDLRPIGLLAEGSPDGLVVGGTLIQANAFVNAIAAVTLS